MTLFLKINWRIKKPLLLHPHPMASLFLLLALAFFLYSPTTAFSLSIDGDKQLAFADACFTEGRFPEAISEYRRFLFFFPEDHRRVAVIYQMGVSYLNTKDYEKASACFSAGFESKEAPYVFSSGIMLARCYQSMGSVDQALKVMDRLIEKNPLPRKKNLALYEKGWLLIEAGRVQEGRPSFLEISPDTKELLKVPELISDLDEFHDVRQKSPGLAGVLSVLPGAGYIYTERYQDAFISFVLNASLIYATCEAFDHDLNGLGGLIGFTAAGFYGGSMYGAIVSAKKFNRKSKNGFIENLIQNHKITIGVNPEKKEGALGVEMTY